MSQRTNLKPEILPSGEVIKKYNSKNELSGIMYNVPMHVLEEEINKIYKNKIKQYFIEDENIEENLKFGYKQSDKYFSGNNRKPWVWVKKTFEKTYKCNSLLKKYCKEHNEIYDIVIRSRPDLKFKHEIKVENINFENNILTFGGWPPGGTHQTNGYNTYFFDGFAISTPENINSYCSFYTDAKEDLDAPTGLEPQLHAYLNSLGLEYKSIGKTKLKSQRPYEIIR